MGSDVCVWMCGCVCVLLLLFPGGVRVAGVVFDAVGDRVPTG